LRDLGLSEKESKNLKTSKLSVGGKKSNSENKVGFFRNFLMGDILFCVNVLCHFFFFFFKVELNYIASLNSSPHTQALVIGLVKSTF